MNITIFGAGAYGSALGETLKSNGHQITYYDPYKYPDISFASVLPSADAYLLAVPSNFARDIIDQLSTDRPFICATKGFLSLSPFIKYPDFSVISGGAFADELLAQKPVSLTGTSTLVHDLFTNSWLTIEQTDDNLGVLLCGSFKNIYAIGSGYRGLTPGTKDFDTYIASACTELKDILSANHCAPATVDLSCGINDLRLTCASTHSRNYSFGQQLAQSLELTSNLATGSATLDITTEGYSAALALSRSGLKLPGNTPLLDHVLKLLTPKS